MRNPANCLSSEHTPCTDTHTRIYPQPMGFRLSGLGLTRSTRPALGKRQDNGRSRASSHRRLVCLVRFSNDHCSHRKTHFGARFGRFALHGTRVFSISWTNELHCIQNTYGTQDIEKNGKLYTMELVVSLQSLFPLFA